jgi:hypothetical protein
MSCFIFKYSKILNLNQLKKKKRKRENNLHVDKTYLSAKYKSIAIHCDMMYKLGEILQCRRQRRGDISTMQSWRSEHWQEVCLSHTCVRIWKFEGWLMILSISSKSGYGKKHRQSLVRAFRNAGSSLFFFLEGARGNPVWSTVMSHYWKMLT